MNEDRLVLRVPLGLRVRRVLPGQKVNEVPLVLKVREVLRFLLVPLVKRASEVFWVEPVQLVRPVPLVL